MNSQNIEENPFAALFPSLSQAQDYRASRDGTKKLLNQEHSVIPSQSVTSANITSAAISDDSETSVRDAVVEKLEVNKIIEQIFLITLDKDTCTDPDRPSRCVYLKELAGTLDGQLWIDSDCLEQAVFERLMLEKPNLCVIKTRENGEDVKGANAAAESEVLRYLYQCYSRWLNVKTKSQVSSMEPHLCHCKEVILMNAKTCFQQPELISQDIHVQFIEIYREEFQFIIGGLSDCAKEFFLQVSEEIDKNKEDGCLSDVFKPLLDHIKKKFENFSLLHSDTTSYINILNFFTHTPALADALLSYNDPADWTNGRSFENTLIGSVLSLSCIPKNETGPYDHFNNPSSYTKQEHDITESNLWLPLAAIGEKVHHLLFSIIKLSPNLRHRVIYWLGKCLHANSGRTKIWSNQLPQLFNQMYCSEGFSLNLCQVMLRLCRPFSEPLSPKLLKIQPTYTVAVAANKDEMMSKGIHAQGLNTETTLVPADSAESLPVESSYSFITECFFLTQQCLNLGFHMVHDKFFKLNQDLHRVQRLYNEVRGQAVNDESEPVRSVKAQMEKGMTLFLSMKAALTEPSLMEMSLNFHLATATWLTQMAASDDFNNFQPVTFPLPQKIPPALGYIPEFIIGNLTDFVLFVQRFKEEMFELSGDRIECFVILILAFMGSPERMKNPHLRAEMADMLAALMPPGESHHGSGGILSSFHRERLFMKHPLIHNLSKTLLHVFVSIEMTGQSVEFEQKFNYRRPMYIVLEYIWEIDIHKDAIKRLANDAEMNIDATDAPLFLRFINLLINDAIFLLDEALQYMTQIKEKQLEKERGDWNDLQPRQRQETEMNFRHLGMLARYHNVMANYTIHSLELLTQEIKSIFCQSALVDRIAGMLNYFLLHLVGPKQRNFKVKDQNDYEFKPQQIVSDITKIYLNLGESDDFCMAVSSDGRSYSPDLFTKAVQVLTKISTLPQLVSDFLTLEDKIRCMAEQHKRDDDLLGDAPDEFLDPIMGTVMKDPVLLPTSKIIVDRSVIARHILSDQSDPFNRKPLNMDMVIPETELKDRIKKWMSEKSQISNKS